MARAPFEKIQYSNFTVLVPAAHAKPKNPDKKKKVPQQPPQETHDIRDCTRRKIAMAKRPADADEKELEAIKNGDRPMEIDQDEVGEFEDEFEDEFESEDEILEAGVDGRPDEEREAEEKESMFCLFIHFSISAF